MRIVAKCLLLALGLLLGACAMTPATPPTPLQQCRDELIQLEAAINRAGVNDAQYASVTDFPTYRSNRFWSSFASDSLTAAQRQYWRRQLHDLGMSSLQIEANNLPDGAVRFSTADFFARCDTLLWQDSLQQRLSTAQLDIPDSYSTLQQFFGLYPLTSRGALSSIRQYQQEMRTLFSDATAFNAATATLYQLTPPADMTPADSTAASAPFKRDPLGIPQLSTAQLSALLEQHAPQFQVEQSTKADQIGAARWQDNRHLIDGAAPVVYAYPSYVRTGNEVLLQLNYTAWFAARPKTGRFDWYGGELDGLVWRVTLKADGSVLFWDSIHPCGCYHSLHLPQDSTLQIPESRDEPLLVFHSALSSQQTRPVLLVQAHTHYLQKVLAQPVASANAAPSRTQENQTQQSRAQKTDAVKTYDLEAYDRLRSLPLESAGAVRHRNWFDRDGLIAASARFERFFLWPLGVPSAGAMRQQGHHAIAFVGRRHFDAAWLEQLWEAR